MVIVLRLIRYSLIGLCLIFAVSCNTTRGTFCSIAKPVSLSDAAVDALSDAEVAALLAHNRKGAALCGWKPQ